MYIIKSDWGIYNLTNATRFDVYIEKTEHLWGAYFYVDGTKVPLHRFEVKKDGDLFCNVMKQQFMKDINITAWDKRPVMREMKDLCKSALHCAMTGVVKLLDNGEMMP